MLFLLVYDCDSFLGQLLRLFEVYSGWLMIAIVSWAKNLGYLRAILAGL